MRKETKEAIEGKIRFYLNFKDKYGTSADHARNSLCQIGVKNLTDDVLLAFLYNGFSTICYDVTALIEARGHPRRGTLEFWKEFYNKNKQIIDDWIRKAKGPCPP